MTRGTEMCCLAQVGDALCRAGPHDTQGNVTPALTHSSPCCSPRSPCCEGHEVFSLFLPTFVPREPHLHLLGSQGCSSRASRP